MFVIKLADKADYPEAYFTGFCRSSKPPVRFGMKGAAVRFKDLVEAVRAQQVIGDLMPDVRCLVEYGG